MELRPYQQEAMNAVLSQWEDGNGKTLLVLPTGCGKTIVFAKITEECVRQGKRVLILAHRGEILEQAADKLEKATGLGAAFEKAEQTCIGSWFRVVVGSVQTLMREKRLANFENNYFDTIIIDEAHHAISDSYQRVLQHFKYADVLGVTATPDRGDMKNLGQVFDSLAYEYTLPRAIKEGYLSPIKAITIPLKLDLSGVSTQAGDFKASDIDTALDPYLYQIADEMKKYCAERKTVVFLPLVKTSQKFRDSYERTNGELRNFTRTTADSVQTEFIKELDNAYLKVVSNAWSQWQAAQEAVDNIIKHQGYVTYPSGHVDTIEVAVIRAIRTGVARMSAALVIEGAKERGMNHVLVSSHLGARVGDETESPCNHAWWQGKVYSIEGGDEKYPNLEKVTGYPSDPRGLCGYNCRHNLTAFDPETMKNNTKNFDDEENKKAYE